MLKHLKKQVWYGDACPNCSPAFVSQLRNLHFSPSFQADNLKHVLSYKHPCEYLAGANIPKKLQTSGDAVEKKKSAPLDLINGSNMSLLFFFPPVINAHGHMPNILMDKSKRSHLYYP
jgi:hypothetical protein